MLGLDERDVHSFEQGPHRFMDADLIPGRAGVEDRHGLPAVVGEGEGVARGQDLPERDGGDAVSQLSVAPVAARAGVDDASRCRELRGMPAADGVHGGFRDGLFEDGEHPLGQVGSFDQQGTAGGEEVLHGDTPVGMVSRPAGVDGQCTIGG